MSDETKCECWDQDICLAIHAEQAPPPGQCRLAQETDPG